MVLGIFICVWWIAFIIRLGFCGWLLISLSILLFPLFHFHRIHFGMPGGTLVPFYFGILFAYFVFLKVAGSALRQFCIFLHLQWIRPHLCSISASATANSMFFIFCCFCRSIILKLHLRSILPRFSFLFTFALHIVAFLFLRSFCSILQLWVTGIVFVRYIVASVSRSCVCEGFYHVFILLPIF